MNIDALFLNAHLFNVYTGRWKNTDIAVRDGRILYVGRVSSAGVPMESARTMDLKGSPVIPGLIDIHLHIESSLCTPAVFADAVLPHGVTTVVSEPHEIANVFGVPGIEEMIRTSRDSSMDIFIAVPSSVPSTNRSLETTGGTIGAEELSYLMDNNPEVICLGEVMNFGELIDGRPCEAWSLIDRMRTTYPRGAVEGHVPSVAGFELAKILYEGVDSDHCLQDPTGLRERLENGMFVEIQEKSVLPEVMAILNSEPVDGLFSFVTDDVPPDKLVTDGHLDHVIRKALALGMPLERAVVAATRSPAGRMGLRDRGAVVPGKIADFVVLKDRSDSFSIEQVFKRGIPADEAVGTAARNRRPFQKRFSDSITLPPGGVASDWFAVPVPTDHAGPTIRVQAMGKSSGTTYTTSETIEVPVGNGTAGDRIVSWEGSCNLAIVVDRYSGRAGRGYGFVVGDDLVRGAFASTHAHDHHNLFVTGSSARDMEAAARWVVQQRGGAAVVADGKIIASLELPVAGILSEREMDELAPAFASVQTALRQCGISHFNPFMTLTTMTLPVSPVVKLTDRGLIEVRSGTILSLFPEFAD